jgi:hypothetical protein
MKEQQHTDDDRGGSTDKSQDEQNLRSGSGVCERQPARNHQHGSHQSVMPVHRHRVAPFLLASRASLTDSEHGKGQMPPYVTLGLAARKALPGSRAAEKDINSSTRGMDGYTFLLLHYAQSAAETRTPGGSAAGNPAAAFSCLTVRAALGTAEASVRREQPQRAPRTCQAQFLVMRLAPDAAPRH